MWRVEAVVAILGSVVVSIDDEPVRLGPQLRRLLALLAVNAGSVIPSDLIAETLWPDELRDTKAVRTYVARLRQSLGDDHGNLVRTQAPGYQLTVDSSVRLDAREFEEALTEALEHDPVTRVGLLDDALALWTGPALAEFADEEWARLEAMRLDQLRVDAHERRFDAALDAGLHASSVTELERLVREHPMRERLWGQLMLALHRSGRQVDALRAYQAHREVMAAAGLDPSAELRLLDERIARDDPLLGLDTEPERIRGYLKGERLGEGAFSVVWRAVQPTVNRDVAIKQVKAELANRSEFVRAFEREANLVAGLEHPRIVPLYDFWREVGAAYLVMRYLSGGTLADAIPRAGVDLTLAATVARHVGEALETAHGRGVVHRDVRPANIFFDATRNAYLGDFGIAIEGPGGEVDGEMVSYGTSGYSPPEQVRHERSTSASDQFCFAVSLYEALSGELAVDGDGVALAPLPAVTAIRSDLPPALDDVLSRATSPEPVDRFGSIREFVEAFVGVIDDRPNLEGATGATVLASSVGENPYRGLAAFGQADAAVFFGRRRLVEELVQRLDGADSGRLLAVVGPSGSGKSSVVRAGLLPALGQGAVSRSDRWFVATMVPGVSPFEELEVALSHLETETHAGLAEVLRGDERGVARAVKLTLPDDESELLLVVDQFEELYTLSLEDERRLFAAALAAAVSDPHSRLRVVLTIRADFWDRPLRDPELAMLIQAGAVHVVPMAPDELEAAMVEPARRAGCDFETGLLARIGADVTGQPGALPLLQYALTELFGRRDGNRLTVSAYREMGGVSGAIAQRAEMEYARLPEDARIACRRLMGALVALGEGTEDTRRRILRRDLGVDPATAAVLEAFGSARLLTFDRDDSTREPTVEIAHEALLREWPRLGTWLDDDRADLTIERHLARASQEWVDAGRSDGELYRGGRLESAIEWAAANPQMPSSIEAEFLAASEKRAAAEGERERNRVRRLRALLVSVAVLLVIALVAGLVADNLRRRADDERAEAERQAGIAEANATEAERQAGLAERSAALTDLAITEAEAATAEADLGRLTAEAARLATEDPDLGMLLAAEAHGRESSTDTLGALQRALVRDDGFLGYLVGEGGYTTNSLAFVGEQLVARSASSVEVWDTTSHELIDVFDVGAGSDLVVAGPRAYTASEGDLAVIDVTSGLRAELTGTGVISALAVSADETMLAVGYSDGHIEIWTGEDWGQRSPIGEGRSEITHLAFSPAGGILTSSESDSCCDFYDVVSRELVIPAQGPLPGSGQLTNFDWVEDGRFVIATGRLEVFDVDGNPLVSVDDHVSFSLAILDSDSVVYGDSVFDLTTGDEMRRLDARDGTARSAAGGADLIAVATDRAISLWSRNGSQLLARAVPREDANTAFVNAGGDRVISLRHGTDFTMWDLDDGAVLEPDLGYEPGVPLMATWMPDGRLMTFDWAEFLTRIWDGESLEPVGSPIAGGWASFTTSPNGELAATGSFDGVVRLYDVESGQLIEELHDLRIAMSEGSAGAGVLEVRFSWDSTLLAAVGSGGVGIWDTETRDFAALLRSPGGEPGYQTVGFSRKGDLLAVGDSSGRVTLVRTSDWTRFGDSMVGGPDDAEPLVGTHGLRFTEDDRYLLFSGRTGAQLFDVVARRRIGGIWPSQPLIHVNPSPTGRQIVTATEQHLLVWEIAPDIWTEIACQTAGRSLTEQEWAEYIGARPYEPVCG
jgi:DNA-binding SARP family transcriptional activator/WD40 repeat protein/type II secretory pathway predicted ATPase ExeA